MKRKLFTLMYILLLLLTPLGVFAKNPAPYVPDQKAGTPALVVFGEIQQMPENSLARKEFFKESQANLGLDESQFKALFAIQGMVKVETCGKCNLETAGLKNNISTYWRTVKPSEEVVFVLIDKQWKPWFLIRCANPVRERKETKPPEPQPPQQQPPAPAVPQPKEPAPEPPQFRPVGCLQGAPLQLLGSTTTRSGVGYSPWSGGYGVADSSHHNNVIFYPTECISETDYQERDKEGKK